MIDIQWGPVTNYHRKYFIKKPTVYLETEI